MHPSILLAIAALSAPLASQPRPGGEPDRAPDVLLILIDDLNDWTGYQGGHPNARTPHIDRLAERGVAFTNAHCASPVCNPSRTSMLGGVRPRASRPRGEKWKQGLAGIATLPQHFASHGYRTLGSGKIFHGSSADAFEEFFRPEMTAAMKAAGQPKGAPFVDLGVTFANSDDFDWRGIRQGPKAMPDYQRVSQLAERLMVDDDQPLFIALGFHRPHLPWYAPKAYFERHPLEAVQLPETVANDLDDVPAEGRAMVTAFEYLHPRIVERELWRPAVQAYLANVSFVDDQLGRLMEALERSPRSDRTIVALVSDHGWHLGEKEHWRKTSLWEESTHIPFILRPAGPAPEGGWGTRDRAIDTMTLYPTLCELAGIPIPAHVEGPSLLPLIADREADWPHAALTNFEQHNALRTDRWRLILYGDGTTELYDHDADPGEFTNLAGSPEHAEVLLELRERLVALLPAD